MVSSEENSTGIHSKIKVLIVDDHQLFRNGVQSILSRVECIQVVGEAGNGEEAYIKCKESPQPDVVLMDIHMPVCDGLQATVNIKKLFPHIHILMLTASDTEESLFDAVKAGALGYILKTSHPSQVIESIKKVSKGEPVIPESLALRIIHEFYTEKKQNNANTELLTEREKEVLKHLSVGESNREIAQSLFISENTVRNHIRNILDKLHLQNRVQAATYALREGYTLEE
ncbi:response regulator [Alicyclobacillus tolerans]|uniref:response regulator n=1 Tax=Alicyclobacillus tolerans TaxID=90970 RepID=UPI003B81A7A0